MMKTYESPEYLIALLKMQGENSDLLSKYDQNLTHTEFLFPFASIQIISMLKITTEFPYLNTVAKRGTWHKTSYYSDQWHSGQKLTPESENLVFHDSSSI